MNEKPLTVLHTSDWHLGRSLYGRKRHEEYEAFLVWLAAIIEESGVDVLLLAGDVFDTGAPGSRAQTQYYRFLCRVAASRCRHVVVIAGNHDSPSFLDAPRELLRTVDVHVIGAASEDPADELLVLCDANGVAELIVCAVPYLRDRDIRTVEPGESPEDKERNLIEGVRRHYTRVVALAEGKRRELSAAIPIVAMGHLFAAGGRTVDGDGVRELYVGTLARVDGEVFPESIDYVALGHLHVPQIVGGCPTRRYSGSPLPMGFGEAGQAKSLCRVEFTGTRPSVDLIAVPVFQPLERIRGDLDTLSARIADLSAAGSRAWLEIVYEGDTPAAQLRDRLDAMLSGSEMELLRVKNDRLIGRVLERTSDGETLDELDVEEVFNRCLQAHQVPEDSRTPLLNAYREIVVGLDEAGDADAKDAGCA